MTYQVCFDSGEFAWDGYPYAYYPGERDYMTQMVLRGRAAELMKEFKSLRDCDVGHTAGVLADCLEDHPELVECDDATILPRLILLLRKSFAGGKLVGLYGEEKR